MFQVSAVAIGVAALLQSSVASYQVMKFVVGCYLIWLGVQRARFPAMFVAIPSSVSRKIFWPSVLIEATNPKLALFYLSFLLPFADLSSSTSVGWQMFWLGALANLLFAAADVVCVLVAHPLRQKLKPEGMGYRGFQLLAAFFFIALGGAAIFSE